MLISHPLSGWSFQSYGVVIIHTGLIKLRDLLPIWGSHHLFRSPEILSTCIATKKFFGIIPVTEKVAEELGFERREEPAYEVNDKGNLFL